MKTFIIGPERPLPSPRPYIGPEVKCYGCGGTQWRQVKRTGSAFRLRCVRCGRERVTAR
jgi:hypothetical protein